MEENEKKATERRKEIIANGSDAAIQIQGALFDFINAKYQGDLQALEQKNSAGLLSDKEYAKQKAEIELKQAKASRTKGIFDATIGIAQAVINALQVQPFFPVGLIMAATAGVTGALQIGSILSAPLPTIPSFAVGTENAPTFGRFGEAGRELMELQSGKLILANKETYFAGNQFKGAKIFTNKQTEEIINRSGHSGFSNSISDTRIVSELQSLKQEIKDKPVFIFDKERNIVGKTSNNHTERYLNRYKFN